MPKFKVKAGSKTFYFNDMADLKNQAQMGLNEINTKLATSKNNEEAMNAIENERKIALKKINEKFNKKIKTLTKDTLELQKDKIAIEKLLI